MALTLPDGIRCQAFDCVLRQTRDFVAEYNVEANLIKEIPIARMISPLIPASKKSSVSLGLNGLGNLCWIQLSSFSSSQPLISSMLGPYAVNFHH